MCELQKYLKAKLSYQQDMTTGVRFIPAACSSLPASCLIQVSYLGYAFSHCRGKEPPKGSSFRPKKACLDVSFTVILVSVAKLV